MNTDDLIGALSRGAGPAHRVSLRHALGWPLAAATAVSLAVGVSLLGAVPADRFATPAPWIKLAYTGTLAAALGLGAFAAGLPARRLRPALSAAAMLVALMAGLGLTAWLTAPPAERVAVLLGTDGSWVGCAPRVVLLALPVFVVATAAMRRLAPVRLRAAGGLAGATAGACGAFAYAFCCPESSAAYVALWYTAAIAACGASGALAGPRLLRW
jgi:hypothetical protein